MLLRIERKKIIKNREIYEIKKKGTYQVEADDDDDDDEEFMMMTG